MWKPKGRVAVFRESGPRSLMQWTAKTGVELARAIREGEVTSTAVLEACLARVKRLDKRLNAVVLLYEDSARARAREADAALAAGTLWGPLHGVPLTIKECMLWANTQCCVGVPGAIDGVDDTAGGCNEPFVRRILDAGGILFGKTNVPKHLGDWQVRVILLSWTNQVPRRRDR